ncbi:YutD family protein [Periweissella fabaria]|uniref:DUF1027 domain-containing protein n=1 Tax=Periweissella fabaria TaxID=546157 RepID=A0ABN8BLJ4_9LACO|nr:YutD family protein [Periweissella fabaria]MCM0597102.1 YutD family protein [Periweissella fabaria]CAH0417114.1 hypothetical protein WFA24289_01431 [Periweissella fabaria]
MDRESLKIKAEAQVSERAATTNFENKGNNQFIVNGLAMTILKNYRDAFDELKFKARFSDILTKYDYIIGDIAADQLRLKGFYAQDNKNMTKFNSIDAFEDYLLEYMNFGAPYFVVQNENPVESKTDFEVVPSTSNNRRRKRNNRGNRSDEAVANKETPTSRTAWQRKGNSAKTTAANKPNNKGTNLSKSPKDNNNERTHDASVNKRRRRRSNANKQRADVKEVKRPIADGKGVKKPDGSMSASTKKPNQRKRHFTIQQKNEK